MKVAVLGTGYVGLVTGVGLASRGHDVTCVDLQPDLVAALNQGRPTIHEAGLAGLLGAVVAAGRFRATLDLAAALDGADAVLVAVGTPAAAGRIDLRAIERAAAEIGRSLRGRPGFLAVIIKSTVVPGTTDTVVARIISAAAGRELGDGWGLGMNPEFLREGQAVQDFLAPDRIVLGSEEALTRSRLQALYASWDCAKLEVNTRTAELIKYAANCLLATQISAVNELANFAAAVGGIDIMEVMQGVHLDRRWNPLLADGTRARPGILDYLVPGCGFGGSCFPKDVQALRAEGQARDLPMAILDGVLAVNAAQPAQVVKLLAGQWDILAGRRILVLGLAFKPGTDDVRESAARLILQDLLAAGAGVQAHDPVAGPNARRAWPELSFELVADWRAALAGCDAVVVATRWAEYLELKSPALRPVLRGRTIVDARRCFAPADFPASGYLAIGRSPRRGAPA